MVGLLIFMLKETEPGHLYIADENGVPYEKDDGTRFPACFEAGALFYLSRIATALERIAEEQSK
jgi:hypothetical protein